MEGVLPPPLCCPICHPHPLKSTAFPPPGHRIMHRNSETPWVVRIDNPPPPGRGDPTTPPPIYPSPCFGQPPQWQLTGEEQQRNFPKPTGGPAGWQLDGRVPKKNAQKKPNAAESEFFGGHFRWRNPKNHPKGHFVVYSQNFRQHQPPPPQRDQSFSKCFDALNEGAFLSRGISVIGTDLPPLQKKIMNF